MHWTKGYLGGWWTEGRSHHAMTASLGSNATVEGDDDANNCTTIENYPSSRPHRSPIFFFLTTTIALALLTLLAGLRATSLGILPSLSASSRSSSKLLETMHTIGGSQDLPAPALLTDVEKEFEKETPQQYAIVEESHDSWPLTKAKVGDEKFVELQRISVPNSDTYNNTSEGDDEFDNMQEEEEDKSDSEKDGEKRHSDGKGTGDGKMEPHDFVALAQGSLLDRLTTLCLAPALAAALVHALNRPPPLMDPSPLPPPSSPHASWTEFSPLISPFNLSLLWLVSGQGSDPLPGHLFRGFPQVDRTVREGRMSREGEVEGKGEGKEGTEVGRRSLKQGTGEERWEDDGVEEGKGVRRAARAAAEGVREILLGGDRGGGREEEGDVKMSVQLAVPDDLDALMAPQGRMYLVEVHLPACNSTAINERLSASQSALLSSQLASERLTVTVLAPAHTLPLLQVWSSNEVCAMHYGLHQCFASLQLSSSVLHLVESELHASPHLQDSTAIYLPSHSSRCSGCAGNLLNCTVREVAWKFLGEPMQPGALALLIDRNGSYVDGRDSKVAFGVATLAMVSSEGKGERGAEEGMDVNGRSHEHSQQQQQQQQRWQQRQGREDGPLIVVASESPRDSLTIQQSFHEGRVPHVMNVTAQQLQRCKQAGRIDCWRLQVAELYLLSMTRGIIMSKNSPVSWFVIAQAMRRLRGKGREKGLGEDMRERGSGTRGTMPAKVVRMRRRKKKGSSGGGKAVREGHVGRYLQSNETRKQLQNEQQDEEEEEDQQQQQVGAFLVFTPICNNKPRQPFRLRRFAVQMIVDEQSKAIYCHVQKAACTSWKLLLILLQQMRAFVEQKKQEGVSLSYLHSLPLSTALQEAQVNISYLMRVVHNRHFSGLKYLDLDYKEHEIVRLLTRPDYFKFSFVRHPLARLLAVFLHIHVRGEDSHPRSHWNRLFFANSTEYQEALAANNGNETFPFDEFTRLLRVTFGKYETKMDRHVLPQSNLCVLSRIRYDFVGRLENSVHDVGYILSRILTPDERSSSLFLNLVTTAFGVGHAVHSTGAIRHLDMFDEESFQNAMAVYSRDLDIPTNDIHYEVPKILLPYMKIIDNIQ